MIVRNISPYKQFNYPTFTAGQINLYSDFDGTYFPEQHSNLHNISTQEKINLGKYFNAFSNFLEKTKDSISFKITTGRTFGEFRGAIDLIKLKGLVMPLPDSLIVKNGSDEYLKYGTDENYYRTGVFPFYYNETNPSKENAINNLTNWNGKVFRKKLIELLKKYDFKIVEHESEHSVRDYGTSSLFAHTKYDNFQLNGKNMAPKSEWVAGIRKDGNLKLYVSFPYDMLNVGERTAAYNDIKTRLIDFLDQNNVQYVLEEKRDAECGNRPVITITPKINNQSLNKLFDTKIAVKKAIQNNDLVIVSGDGINDFEMLNPLNYIEDLPSEVKLKISQMAPEDAIKYIENSPVAEQLKKLPFIGIVIKNDNNNLDKLFKIFGKFNKIIQTENGGLQNGIKQAVKFYAQSSKEFAKNLDNEIKKICDITINSNTKTNKSSSKAAKSSLKKIGLFIGGALSCISGIIYSIRKNNKKGKI